MPYTFLAGFCSKDIILELVKFVLTNSFEQARVPRGRVGRKRLLAVRAERELVI